MAEENGFRKGSKRSGDFIAKVMKKLKRCVDAEAENRKNAIDDLKFLNGEQWDDREKQRRSRKNRPALQVNLLPKFVDQVTGDARHRRPGIRLRPVGGKADVDIAKIREGIVRNIEYISDAPLVYDQGLEMAVSCGYGAWRVLTRYTDDNPFQQEIYIEALDNPFLAYIDPDAKSQVGADAKYGFVLERMAKDKFEAEYPNADVPGDHIKWGRGVDKQNWYDKDSVTVAEYFEMTTKKVKMHLLEDGLVVTDEEYRQMVDEYNNKWTELIDEKTAQFDQKPPMPTGPAQPPKPSMAPGGGPILNEPKPPVPQGQPGVPPQAPGPQPGGMPPQGAPAPGGQMPGMPQQPMPQQAPDMRIPRNAPPKSEKTREADVTVIKHYKMTCMEVLEGPTEFPGKFIPIVFVYGKERNIEGKRYVRGLIRDAKDPQKMLNYAMTSAAEVIALQPKAPWIGTAKQFEGYEQDYAAANVENFPFLKYNGDPEANAPPTRQSPGQPPVALFQQMKDSEEHIKAVIGMYNADVGNFGSEQTGRAVTAKQRPGDIATFHFPDNWARSIAYTGKIINDMIPVIYDTERDMRLRNLDDTETFVPVNTTASNALKLVKENPERYVGMNVKKLMNAIRKYGPDAKFNDMTIGKYDVVAVAGPSYSTAREESRDFMLQLAQAMPQQMANAVDILMKNMDFKDADELAKRFRKMIPAHLIELKEGEEPPPQMPMPPAVQIQMAKLQIEQGKIQLQMLKSKQEELKLQHEQLKIQLELAKAGKGQNIPQSDPNEIAEKMAKLQLEKRRIDLEEARFMHQMGMDTRKHDLDKFKTGSDHSVRMMEAVTDMMEPANDSGR